MLCPLCNLHESHPRGNGCEDLCDVCFARWEALGYPNEMDTVDETYLRRLRQCAESCGMYVRSEDDLTVVACTDHPHGFGLIVDCTPDGYVVHAIDVDADNFTTQDPERVCAFIKDNV